MGRVTIQMEPLADQAIVKGWYPLTDKEGATAQGEVYLVLQWRRNRDLAFEPFSDQTEAEFLAKEPNELRIAAVGALGLAVADKNLLSAGGSSDPFLTFSLEGSSLKTFKTKPKKKSLDPVWHEQFARSVTPGKEPMKLVCTCEDWDEVRRPRPRHFIDAIDAISRADVCSTAFPRRCPALTLWGNSASNSMT